MKHKIINLQDVSFRFYQVLPKDEPTCSFYAVFSVNDDQIREKLNASIIPEDPEIDYCLVMLKHARTRHFDGVYRISSSNYLNHDVKTPELRRYRVEMGKFPIGTKCSEILDLLQILDDYLFTQKSTGRRQIG